MMDAGGPATAGSLAEAGGSAVGVVVPPLPAGVLDMQPVTASAAETVTESRKTEREERIEVPFKKIPWVIGRLAVGEAHEHSLQSLAFRSPIPGFRLLIIGKRLPREHHVRSQHAVAKHDEPVLHLPVR